MKKKGIIVSLSLLLITEYCCAQQVVSCKILDSFLKDTTIAQLFGNDFFNRDTIKIIDSAHYFKNCTSIRVNEKPVVVVSKNSLNLNPYSRNDVPDWKGKILVYRVVARKQNYKIYFFYKPTNANGFVSYRITSGKITNISYSVGQL